MIDFTWQHGTIVGVIVAGFGALWRKLSKMHRIMLQWNGNKVTVEKDNGKK